jgi:membrane fusion protein, multidrug efflux system
MAPEEPGATDAHNEDQAAARPPRRSTEQQGAEKPEPRRKPALLQRPWVLIGGGALLLVLLAGGLIWWLIARNYEDTDDAYIDTHVVHLAPRISGQVTRVLARDNQRVHAGQLLVEIDPADYQTRLNQLLAQVAQAQTQLVQAQAQVQLSEASYGQAQASAMGAAAQAINAHEDLTRYEVLKRTQPLAVAQEQLDTAVATARNTADQRDAADKQTRGAADQIRVAMAQVAGAEAAVKSIEAQVAEAALDLSYTRIVAPMDGHVAQRSVQVGDYVSPGQELLAIVPLRIWVTANFKETQLAQMRPGQHVDIDVDACPQATLHGHVDSIQRGAGQAFGLLPPENATGNWVKVVQRVPVKIVFDGVPDGCTLGPGMSVEPSVEIH